MKGRALIDAIGESENRSVESIQRMLMLRYPCNNKQQTLRQDRERPSPHWRHWRERKPLRTVDPKNADAALILAVCVTPEQWYTECTSRHWHLHSGASAILPFCHRTLLKGEACAVCE